MKNYFMLSLLTLAAAAPSLAASARWISPSFTAPDAREKVAYSIDLSKHVKTTAGGALNFALTNSPRWASISPTGILSGTPTAADIGKNVFTVNVMATGGAGDAGDIAQVIIHVRGGAKPSLVCGDGSAAYLVGHSEDRKLDFFSCNH